VTYPEQMLCIVDTIVCCEMASGLDFYVEIFTPITTDTNPDFRMGATIVQVLFVFSGNPFQGIPP